LNSKYLSIRLIGVVLLILGVIIAMVGHLDQYMSQLFHDIYAHVDEDQ
jgi:hypothetical protein